MTVTATYWVENERTGGDIRRLGYFPDDRAWRIYITPYGGHTRVIWFIAPRDAPVDRLVELARPEVLRVVRELGLRRAIAVQLIEAINFTLEEQAAVLLAPSR